MDVAGMQNARMGAIYLWQGIDYKSNLAQLVVGGAIATTSSLAGLKDITIPNFAAPNQIMGIAAQSGVDVAGSGGLLATIKAWASDFVGAVWTKIKAVFGDIAEVAGHLKNIAVFIAQQVFAKAAPLIGGAVGLVQGLWKVTVAFTEKLGNWIAKKDVRLTFGHPKTLVTGVEQGLTRALLEGIYETARSAVSIGLNAASFGGAVIVDAIAAIAEAVVKLIWRVAEYKIVNTFIASAKTFWSARGTKASIHLDSDKFDAWLKPATQKVPVIAALTLGAGVAGDKMRFLQMYSGDGGIITDSQFKSGVKYLDGMKRAGARLLERSDMEFESADPVIAGLLKLARSHDLVESKSSLPHRLFRIADKIVRA